MTHILITRPEGKGVALAEQLEQAGYQTSLFPVLNINYLTPSSTQLSPLINADKIIFISQDAVKALAQLKPDINIKAQFYAVGQQTADTIYELFGVRAATPKQFDSEGVLALKSLAQVDGSNIVLVKGQGGRPDIAKVLKERGAFLNNCVVYEREPVSDLTSNWTDHWQSNNVHGIVITSNAAVDAIFTPLAAQQLQWLQQCHFYVASERIAAYLQQQHVSLANIHIAAGASDNAMFTCINQQGSSMSEQPKSITTENTTSTASSSASVKNEPASVKNKPANDKQKVSKVASLALLISLVVASGVGYEFYQKLNAGKAQNTFVNELSEQNKLLQQELAVLKSSQVSLQQALFNSEEKVSEALAQSTLENEQALKNALQKAQQQGSSLNPQEVTSLQRMAEFKLWAEKDYQGASAVLKRLDGLLSEHPGTIELRQSIMQDIQTLDSLKPVATEAIYLQLNSVLNRIDELVFNAVNLPEEPREVDENALSEDINDWQQNISNSWNKIVDSFIKIRRHEGIAVEPLLTDQERNLINQRIKLNIAQAQDALLSKQASIYFNALSEAKRLIGEYFKQDDAATKSTLNTLSKLEKEPLNFSQEVTLQSTQMVKEWAQ
ncbi:MULTISPECIES: uroporphyrinogen-III synthase [unclassified Pseudoalteromonas]|uniref:uroporphyrinogen-III synthase n=1 Tax=unclassified Pseudoalteromonas TaxID=194690 RepID=UPI001109FF03|nr:MULTISPECIES: uroporphyrinogen-III synthase [unclassified Pseudoalteromonas]MBW4967126.1 uroporphyrinogen-III synthase [Pseudoalteromonas sp. CR1]TMN79196.1 uroporphyrinogen-III synthase [Pseudoalteromonas sp. S410]TMN88805.1 uroporphyrinogen-III synthase [Pseudoalteromonas sp. S408]TMN98953.1 uroporphyrinogen-III synthase [Pseudoalteromonas sp. S407]TMO01358.1 uroporphyrinogen-III synthase [Pseudoalteromonas sp. S409]